MQSLCNAKIDVYRKPNQKIITDGPARILGYEARRFIVELPVPRPLIQHFKLPADEKYRELHYIFGPVDNMLPSDAVFVMIKMQINTDNGRFDKMLPTFEAIMSTFQILLGKAGS